MINIAVCDDDLVFASKVETILYDIAKQKLIDIAVEVFSDGSELWKHISSGETFEWMISWSTYPRLTGSGRS